MKNIFITIVTLFLSVTTIFGQDSLYVYKNGIIHPRYALTQIDSLSFTQTLDSVKFNKNGSVLNKLLIANIDSITFKQPLQSGSYVDIDGNVYTTVKIGTQTWMVENLKTTKFRNGDNIPFISDTPSWTTTNTAAMCDYNNDALNGTIYGHLYNWFAAVDNRIIAPAGWHVPSVDEWSVLKNYLIANGFNYNGNLLDNKIAKSMTSKTLWKYNSSIGTPGNNPSQNNTSGFNALPAGGRYGTNGVFFSNTEGSYFWTTTEDTDTEAQYRGLYYGYNWFGEFTNSKRLGFSIRCIKSDLAILTTTTISSITAYSANSGGNISYDGHDPITSRGLCWDTITNPTISKNLSLAGVGKGSFISAMSNLLPGKMYFVRAYATNSAGTAYANELNFNTLKTKPVLSTLPYSELTHNSLKSGGNISSNGGAQITARGICWSLNHNPIVKPDSVTVNGIGVGQYESSISGLLPNTNYYIRAYATNSEGTSYGNEISVKTLTTIPTLTSTSINSITTTSASSGGVIISNGGDNITKRGVCWSVNPNPILKPDSISTDGIGSGTFTSSISTLSPGTTYYLRAYATNSVGTAYGNELSFKTLSVIPTLSTSPITLISSNSASSGGQITSNGGENVTARGVCWSVNPNPILKPDSITTNGSGSGLFTSLINALQPGTTYYLRAYATNSVGTAYGNELSFKTLSVIPTLTTSPINLITSTGATSGGEIISIGGEEITKRGVCWSLNPTPVIKPDSITTDGIGSGVFTSIITTLNPGTTYYIRAYATNSVGTAYGNEISFKTISTKPSINTSPVSSITNSTATSGGVITSNGGENIIARGVCWSVNPNPVIQPDSITSNGIGSGLFTSTITNLKPGKTYYLRAYATNSIGTAYGNELSFKSLSAVPTLNTNIIGNITSISATCGGDVVSDGGEEITKRGVCWSVNPNPVVRPDSVTTDGIGIGTFTSSITPLNPGTTYFLRAYATNSVGTAYGNEINFKTLSSAPALISSIVHTISDNSSLYEDILSIEMDKLDPEIVLFCSNKKKTLFL